MAKQRLSASVDANLLEAGQDAVAAGRVESISEWVNEALRRQASHDARLESVGEFIAAYEAEHGEITDAEIEDAYRRAKARAIIVRDGRILTPSSEDAT
ncbi:MAG: hypothetical protein ACR2LK_03655 [Solirubrobacteraceae bacterium]